MSRARKRMPRGGAEPRGRLVREKSLWFIRLILMSWTVKQDGIVCEGSAVKTISLKGWDSVISSAAASLPTQD